MSVPTRLVYRQYLITFFLPKFACCEGSNRWLLMLDSVRLAYHQDCSCVCSYFPDLHGITAATDDWLCQFRPGWCATKIGNHFSLHKFACSLRTESVPTTSTHHHDQTLTLYFFFQVRTVSGQQQMIGYAGSSQVGIPPGALGEEVRVDCCLMTNDGRSVITGSSLGPPQVWDMQVNMSTSFSLQGSVADWFIYGYGWEFALSMCMDKWEFTYLFAFAAVFLSSFLYFFLEVHLHVNISAGWDKMIEITSLVIAILMLTFKLDVTTIHLLSGCSSGVNVSTQSEELLRIVQDETVESITTLLWQPPLSIRMMSVVGF